MLNLPVSVGDALIVLLQTEIAGEGGLRKALGIISCRVVQAGSLLQSLAMKNLDRSLQQLASGLMCGKSYQ